MLEPERGVELQNGSEPLRLAQGRRLQYLIDELACEHGGLGLQ